MVGPAAKREAVAHLRNVLQMSERRACTLVAADRTMVRYRSRRTSDVELRTRLRDLANQRRRFGYRRLFVLLREQGEPSGIRGIKPPQSGLPKIEVHRHTAGPPSPAKVRLFSIGPKLSPVYGGRLYLHQGRQQIAPYLAYVLAHQ
jgi:hypothetical protein